MDNFICQCNEEITNELHTIFTWKVITDIQSVAQGMQIDITNFNLHLNWKPN